MSELVPYTQQLPTRIEDLAQFLLVAPEKAKAVKAEIQAIKNLGLATEVYDQKLEEQRRLAELILDASVKVGEFTRTLPKKERMRTDLLPDSAVGQTKTKTVHELGFSPKQVERFETLADNADLVERVKVEARESGEIPTRTKVLDLAYERRKRQDEKLKEDFAEIDRRHDDWLLFGKAIEFSDLYKINDEVLRSVSVLEDADEFTKTLDDLSKMLTLLTLIREKLILFRRESK